MDDVLVPDFFKHGPRGGRIGIRHLVQNGEGGNQVTRFTVNSERQNVNGVGNRNSLGVTDYVQNCPDKPLCL